MNGEKRNSGNRGIILGFLCMICEKIADVFAAGFIFKLFTSHEKVQSAYESSATAQLFLILKKKTSSFFASIKKTVARQFENSALLKLISKLFGILLNTSSRVFGIFLLTWSAYAVLIAIIKRFVALDSQGTFISLICGIVVFAVAIPLLFSDRSIIELCSESTLVSSFLTRVVGVPNEILRRRGKLRSSQSPAVILGIVLGMMTYFIAPIYMLTGVATVVAVSLIFTYPEFGVVISIAVAPLIGVASSPSVALALLVLLTAASYFIKVVRGKRTFKFDLTELTVYGFIAAVFLGGFAPGSSNTGESALLTVALMLIFPLTVNLMKHKHWIKTCIAAFAAPAALVAFIGIAQYALGLAPYGWIDESLFGGITSRSTSVFNNPNILGVYLVTVFPICLMLTFNKKNSRIAVLGGISSAFIVFCTVFTFSRSAWLALCVGGILFAVLVSPNGILWTIPTAGVAALASFLFPQTIGARMVNFVTLADSANSYRISVWKSSLDMFFNVLGGGVGMGEEAFRVGYINFAETGTQSVMHSHNLLLQIGIQLGFAGAALFILSMLSVSGKCATATVKKNGDKELSFVIKAAISGATALLAVGVFDYPWYNYRIMFIFWALLGLACAAVNIDEYQQASSQTVYNDENYAYVSVEIPQTAEKTKKQTGRE